MAAPALRSNPGIVSFPALFEAKPDPNGNLKFSVSLIFKGGKGVEPLKAAAEALLKQKFPNEKLPPRFKLPFRDGADYADKDGYEEGDIFVQFSRRESFGAVPIVGPNRIPITDRTQIYPGCLGIVYTRPFVWHHAETNKSGLSFSLEAFQKASEGDPIAGFAPVDVEEAFADIENDPALTAVLE